MHQTQQRLQQYQCECLCAANQTLVNSEKCASAEKDILIHKIPQYQSLRRRYDLIFRKRNVCFLSDKHRTTLEIGFPCASCFIRNMLISPKINPLRKYRAFLSNSSCVAPRDAFLHVRRNLGFGLTWKKPFSTVFAFSNKFLVPNPALNSKLTFLLVSHICYWDSLISGISCVFFFCCFLEQQLGFQFS